jgi:hypothetical protein
VLILTVLGYVLLAVTVAVSLLILCAAVRWCWVGSRSVLSSRGEVAEAPPVCGDEMAVARAVGVTAPPADGAHDDLPADRATDAVFWALAKTAGIGADR